VTESFTFLLEDSQACDDMVWGVQDQMFDFDIKEELEVEVQTQLF
jgi:hypothetical protein